ncbi:leucine carboxyl methyltransferase 1-like [Panonychus citri]|uniref:leucine carboxyl methyltransferase 1-like n=1 Tax=Panonychus citri TaxID=50023 RepID=UPI002307BDCE|nr:leucine carboxyl methyltransferase 1-like [Panonychus citri]
MITNDDCTNCKRAAIKLGYWQDPYIDLFSRGTPHIERKTPEINRGYFARVAAIKIIIEKFLASVKGQGKQCQIVNLGCGFDTLYWRLMDNNDGGDTDRNVDSSLIKHFVDVDLYGITSRKIFHIRHRPKLLSSLGDDIQFNPMELQSNVYKLIPVDLRDTNSLSTKLLTECHLDKELPTLFIAECVLIYMTVEHSNNLIAWISANFTQPAFINYEQINIFDRFGQIMVDNLRQRDVELLDLDSCKDLESQKSRFICNGWDNVEAWDMYHVYRFGIPPNELHRIENIEFLDEANLLEQLLTHYCLVVAKKNLPNFKVEF